MAEEEFGDACIDLHTYTSITDLYTRFSTLLFEALGGSGAYWWQYMSMAFTKRRMASLPSWVPDLHENAEEVALRPFRSLLHVHTYSHSDWQASFRPPTAATGSRPDEIVLRGKLLDDVMLVHPEVPWLVEEVSRTAACRCHYMGKQPRRYSHVQHLRCFSHFGGNVLVHDFSGLLYRAINRFAHLTRAMAWFSRTGAAVPEPCTAAQPSRGVSYCTAQLHLIESLTTVQQ